MKSIINSHNKTIIDKGTPATNTISKCNCIKKENCPLQNNCLTENIIYQATVTSNQQNYEPKTYIGASATTFKKRFANHKKSFSHKRYENETELSKEIWKIKDQNFEPSIQWKILKNCHQFNRENLKCSVCINEKFEIATCNDKNILNKRSELVSKCRHINKFLLFQKDSKD